MILSHTTDSPSASENSDGLTVGYAVLQYPAEDDRPEATYLWSKATPVSAGTISV